MAGVDLDGVDAECGSRLRDGCEAAARSRGAATATRDCDRVGWLTRLGPGWGRGRCRWMYILWPVTLPALALVRLVGQAFIADVHRLGDLRLEAPPPPPRPASALLEAG